MIDVCMYVCIINNRKLFIQKEITVDLRELFQGRIH